MGFFNKMIYGDPNKKDLIVEEKQNPIQAFFEILKIKIWELCKVNLLFALFVIPTAVWVGINFSVLSQNMGENASDLVDGVTFIFLLGMIPCIMIMSIGLPSLSYITRSYAREFHVWLFEDFIEKIKENWKQSLLYSLVLGVAIFLLYFGIRFYTLNQGAMPGAMIFRTISYVMLGLVLLSTIYAYPLMVTFELKFKHLIRNSIILTIGRLPQTLLIVVLTGIIPVLLGWLALTWQYGLLVFIAYFALFGMSFNAFIINAFTNQVFERFIIARDNKEAERKPEVEREEKKRY